ncbi:MAG: ABC transporter substrate-binding protein, partial [Candidatus Woesearchaeota archaeon]|nr:ABC transporter substrate-binding protein [Candidatus Woesearchaeota archaeon]
LKDVFVARAKEIGLNLIATESFDPNEADMRTQIQKIKSANAEAIYLLALPQEAGIALKQLKEAGLTGMPIVGADGSKDDAVISGAAGAAEGFLVTTPGVPDSAELETFNTAYKSRYGKDWQPYTPEAYDAIMILAKACASTDCTSTAMKDYLYKMGPYKGASGTFEFDSFGEVQKPYDYFQVKDGKWVKAQLIDKGGLVG